MSAARRKWQAQGAAANATAADSQRSGGDRDSAEEELDVPEEIDSIVGMLLGSLADKDTVVRWAAAKAVARLAERLPKEYVARVFLFATRVRGRERTVRADGRDVGYLYARFSALPPRRRS